LIQETKHGDEQNIKAKEKGRRIKHENRKKARNENCE